MSEALDKSVETGSRVQWVMVWVLPLVVIGGLLYSPLGLVAAGMMVVLMGLSLFRGRYWCGRACPRGAFLDIVMSRLTAERTFPPYLRSLWVRVPLLAVMMGALANSLASMELNAHNIGGVFVRLCLITTLGAIAMALVTQRRAWCGICPMGTTQNLLSRVGPARRHPAPSVPAAEEMRAPSQAPGNVIIDPDRCRRCGACRRACPMDIAADDFLQVGQVTDPDCIRCYECVTACPFGALTAGNRE